MRPRKWFYVQVVATNDTTMFSHITVYAITEQAALEKGRERFKGYACNGDYVIPVNG